ncbi:hypothetical protein [Conservatibacter flavescens]|uniref:Uncharacterized protein n=1 Tax=Conservatibacter flavescens TaxID=28161 RepID=A0A2M8S4W3_9PAST|nr:hypothetical protein [Conservatibacter flavescens]PJG86182.1 hypothetical protein CVP05_03155 [Conservatibacter flavescens]
MDKHSILKFFNDNSQTKSNNTNDEMSLQIMNHGNIVVNYGDNATTNVGCEVNNNENLTCEDKAEVNALIRTLENKKAHK